MKSPRFVSPRVTRRACLMLVACAVFGLSCSSGLQSVSGKVLHKGQPIKGAVVTLHPKGGVNDVKALRPSGVSDEQGSFTLSTGRDTGAPAGDYVVTVVWLQQPPGANKPRGTDQLPDPVDQFQGRYADAKNSKLNVTVKSGVSQLDPINLD